jgi:hypothetical protein
VLAISDPVTRDLAVDGFLRDRRDSHIVIARKHIQSRGENPARFLDDILSIVLEQDYQLLQEVIADPAVLDEVQNWSGFLHARCRNAVAQFFETGLGAPMARMAGVMRRRGQLAATRRELLATNQCEPSDEEVVEQTNARMRATRKNPEKQGMICTISDLYIHSDVSEILDSDDAVAPQDDFLVHSSEGPVIVEAIIADATSVHEDLGLVADAWLGDLYGPDPAEPIGQVRTVAEVAQLVGMTRSVVTDHVATIRSRAAVVVANIVGITPDDYQEKGKAS